MSLLLLILLSNGIGFGFYYGMALFFHYRYYQSNAPKTGWKCQPDRQAKPHLIKKDFIVGSSNLFVLSTLTAIIIYYLILPGHAAVYFDIHQHSLLFAVVTGIIYFLWIDLSLYILHRLFHTPFLFRHFHYLHHRNTSPIAINALALHPVEALSFYVFTLLPLFWLPTYFVAPIIVVLYTNYVSLLDHSGVKFQSRLFWQSPSLFHDDHHKYFHVNFGQTCWFWDRVFNTWRCHGKIYGPKAYEKLQALNLLNQPHYNLVEYWNKKSNAQVENELIED